MFETLLCEIDARGVAYVTLNRVEKHNTLSGQMMDDLTRMAQVLGDDPVVRVVVLQAKGASFCAGGDLNWMQDQITGNAHSRRAAATKLAMMLRALNHMPKPLIARVQGPAYGGGVGVLSVCDLCIGAEGVMFGMTETKLGLIPATISPYVVARIGHSAARRHFMASRLFDGAEAVRIGLLGALVPPDRLDAAVEAEVAPFLTCAPGAVGAAKSLVARLSPVISDDLVQETIGLLVDRWESAEAVEGIAAFLAKRPPNWQN